MDVKKFIAEVKKRPAIYDVNCVRYNDRQAKTDAWYDVCSAMVANWNELGNDERMAEEKSLRNKWRNIRDYFMKDLRTPGNQKTGNKTAGRKRKKYWYHNELLFLLPSAKTRRKAGSRATKSKSVNSMERLKDEMEIHEIIELENNAKSEDFNVSEVSPEVDDTPRDIYAQHQNPMCETSLATFDHEISTDVIANGRGNQRPFNTPDDDYDKMFLLSLLPSFRCVPEHMKLHVRIQMQQVIASSFHPSNHHAD